MVVPGCLLAEIYNLVDNYCTKTQKRNAKSSDILFSRYTTIFHCCEKCLRALFFVTKW